MKKEPLIHSQITDFLEDDHPLAHEYVTCKDCKDPLHVGNESMGTWVETGRGNFCVSCFAKSVEEEHLVLDDDWGL